MHYRINFDGSCWPNPGGKCRWGFIVERKSSDYWWDFASLSGDILDEPRTNNVAEITACLEAIRWVSALRDVESLEVRGDSRLAIGWASGRPVKDRSKLRLIELAREVVEPVEIFERYGWQSGVVKVEDGIGRVEGESEEHAHWICPP